MGCKLELELLETVIKYIRQKLNVATKICFLACFQPVQNSWCLLVLLVSSRFPTWRGCISAFKFSAWKVVMTLVLHFLVTLNLTPIHVIRSHDLAILVLVPTSFKYFFHDWYLLIRLREVQQCLTIIRHTFSCTANWCLVPKTVYVHADVLCATLCLFFTDCFVLMFVCFLPHNPDGDY